MRSETGVSAHPSSNYPQHTYHPSLSLVCSTLSLASSWCIGWGKYRLSPFLILNHSLSVPCSHSLRHHMLTVRARVSPQLKWGFQPAREIMYYSKIYLVIRKNMTPHYTCKPSLAPALHFKWTNFRKETPRLTSECPIIRRFTNLIIHTSRGPSYLYTTCSKRRYYPHPLH